MSSLGWLLGTILNLLCLLILIRALLSWMPRVQRNQPAILLLWRITEPLLKPFRRLVPPWKTGGMDLSPAFAMLVLIFLRRLLLEIMPTPTLWWP